MHGSDVLTGMERLRLWKEYSVHVLKRSMSSALCSLVGVDMRGLRGPGRWRKRGANFSSRGGIVYSSKVTRVGIFGFTVEAVPALCILVSCYHVFYECV